MNLLSILFFLFFLYFISSNNHRNLSHARQRYHPPCAPDVALTYQYLTWYLFIIYLFRQAEIWQITHLQHLHHIKFIRYVNGVLGPVLMYWKITLLLLFSWISYFSILISTCFLWFCSSSSWSFTIIAIWALVSSSCSHAITSNGIRSAIAVVLFADASAKQ